MSKKEEVKSFLKDKFDTAKKIAQNPETKKAVKDVWKSLKDVVDTFDINKN